MARILDPLLKKSQWIAGIAVSLLGGATMYPHTLGLSPYRKVVAQFVNGEEQPIDEGTKKLTEEVLIAANLKPEEEAGYGFFTAYGHDIQHRGSCKLRSGSYIGIPATFTYTDPNQVQTEKIMVNNKPIIWDSKAGQLLLQSIVLSEKAKKFAIAREIQYTNTHYVTIEVLLSSSFGILAYTAGFVLNNLLQLRRIMKRWGRGFVFSLIGGAFWVLYAVLDDTYYCRRDVKADYRVAQMGKDYTEGGVEFYNKLLQRNMALRLMLGSEGERLYTVYGNDIAGWRRPHATLSERRDLLSAHLAQMTEKNQEKTDSVLA